MTDNSEPAYLKEIKNMRERYTLQRTDSVKPMGGNELSKEGLKERLEEDFSFKSELTSAMKL